MVSVDHFRQELLAQMGRASARGAIDMLVNSGELHRSLGGNLGSAQGMPSCCEAMQAEIKPGDILLVEKANGAGMTVRYRLPRSAP
jgi:UDP-N-acetylmuramyl pentapeptide synthase